MLTGENFAVIDAIRLSTDVVVGRRGAAATEKVCSRERGFLVLVCLSADLQICRLNCMWLTIHYPRQQFIMREVGVSTQTVVDWSSFCREVCVYWLERQSPVLGGQGVVVEIDEAKIGRRKRGRWVNGNWIFGGIERGTDRCFIVPVQNCVSDTFVRCYSKLDLARYHYYVRLLESVRLSLRRGLRTPNR